MQHLKRSLIRYLRRLLGWAHWRLGGRQPNITHLGFHCAICEKWVESEREHPWYKWMEQDKSITDLLCDQCAIES